MKLRVIIAAMMAVSACGGVHPAFASSVPPIDVIGTYVGTEVVVQHNIDTGARTTLKHNIVLAINPNGTWTMHEDSAPLGLTGAGNYGVAGLFLVEDVSPSYFTVVGTLKNGTLKATVHLGDTGGTVTVLDGKITAKRTN